MRVASDEECPECRSDFWCGDMNEYLCARVEGESFPICKTCEEDGLDSGTLKLHEIKEPRHLTFVAHARPHVKSTERRIVTGSWSHLVATIGPVPHSYDIAMVDDNLACFGDYLLRSLKNGGPTKGDFEDDAFYVAAWEEGVRHFIVFLGKHDEQGTPVSMPQSVKLDDYVHILQDVALSVPFRNNVYVSTYDESTVVPSTGLKAFYYDPDKSLTWYESLSEVERKWRTVPMMRSDQYTLKRVF